MDDDRLVILIIGAIFIIALLGGVTIAIIEAIKA